MQQILAINPGSTSTKLALVRDGEICAEEVLPHAAEELARFPRVADQAPMRLACVHEFLLRHGVPPAALAAVVARGGLLRPMPSGVYRVGPTMLADLRAARYGEHASNLGALLAQAIADAATCPAYIVDPVVVDEMDPVARLSGLPGIERRSIFHALNHKSAAREVAARLGKPYEACRFIVAHLGGGISVGAHAEGRVIDVNNALDGDGPFAPERAGGLPAGQLASLCFDGSVAHDEIRKRLTGRGGLVAYCGTNRLDEVRQAAAAGNAVAAQAYEAMAYQVSQEIAKHGATLAGRVDRIVLTGGMARDTAFVERIAARVRYLAPVEVVPGEREMISLARGCLAVLAGTEVAREYTP